MLGTGFYEELSSLFPKEENTYRQLKDAAKMLCFSIWSPAGLIEGMRTFENDVVLSMKHPQYADKRASVHSAIEEKIRQILPSTLRIPEQGSSRGEDSEMSVCIVIPDDSDSSSIEEGDPRVSFDDTMPCEKNNATPPEEKAEPACAEMQIDAPLVERWEQITDSAQRDLVVALLTDASMAPSLIRFDASIARMNATGQWREIRDKVMEILKKLKPYLAEDQPFVEHVYNLFHSPLNMTQFLDLAYLEIVKSFLLRISCCFPGAMKMVDDLNAIQLKDSTGKALSFALKISSEVAIFFSKQKPKEFKEIVADCLLSLPLNPIGFTQPWINIGEEDAGVNLETQEASSS